MATPPRIEKEYFILIGIIVLVVLVLFQWCAPSLRKTLFSGMDAPMTQSSLVSVHDALPLSTPTEC